MKQKKYVLVFLLLLLQVTSMTFAQGFGDRVLFNDRWSFHLGDIQFGGIEQLDHSGWRVLDLPHDWSVEGIASTKNASCTGFLPGGIAWYRKSFDMPVERKGQQVYIYFGGVYNNSEVFINGINVGKRPNGYISFMYDLTPYLKFGAKNTIAVRVNHSEDADSRWYTGSGIYRDVYMVYAQPVHIDLWGVYYTTKQTGATASIQIETNVINTNSKDGAIVPLVVKQELFDATGKKITSTISKSKVTDKNKISQGLHFSNPVLWTLDAPYLYTLTTTLLSGKDTLDKTSIKVGMRTISFDANKGFALNGVSEKLKGVCIHHDAGALGSAVPKEVWRRRFSILKDMGCNAIRMSHNPQATDLYDLCDELGLLVIDEAFDEWEYPKHKWITGWNDGEPGLQGSSTYFKEWSARDLSDMVCRDRNHPSIIMWSIGNEIDYPQDPYSHPILNQAGIRQKHKAGHIISQPGAENMGYIAKDLVSIIKKFDQSRPTTAALAAPVMSNETDYPKALDVVGYNYTESSYEKDHTMYPDRIFYGSENGTSLEAWKAVTENDYILGQFLWTGYDFLGEAGSWPSRGSTAGQIDLAGNIKPRGYFRKALWSTSPTAYAGTYPYRAEEKPSMNAPALWNYKEEEKIRVVCYTNCEEAELLLNGNRIGDRKPYDKATGIIFWDIPFSAGKLEVLAFNKGIQKAASIIETVGKPAYIAAEADKKSFTTKGEVAHVMVTIKDKDGRTVPFADTELLFQVSDNAVLLGTENASSVLPDNFKDNIQRCRNGKVLLYIRSVDPSKPVHINISAPLFEELIVTL
ncbi:MAG: glycoside hydrolase [Ferruginibacter sp.]|uniref:sugar-binding domain-containing protein n=1 Tax=Ferruginibacter sp. TaxID=1940288 RepID=UPI002659079B|nr:sugar-binding domain-containing protein [Ferruginibacter sp.]MDB5276457.1 glycoside hydrolase [Ferruginibacter sp.]